MKVWTKLKGFYVNRILITSERYFLSHDVLTLDRWIDANKGHFHKLRRDVTVTESPWLVRPLIRLLKLIGKKVNGWFGYKTRLLDILVYERLFNSHIRKFGQPDHRRRWLECKKRLALLRFKRVLTGDDFILNYIAIEEQKLFDLDPTKLHGMTHDETLSVLAQFQGVGVIHRNQITVTEYENLMLRYVRATSKQK